jgi:hypothetical protein
LISAFDQPDLVRANQQLIKWVPGEFFAREFFAGEFFAGFFFAG